MDKKFPLLKIEDIHKEYTLGDTIVKAVDGVNLEIEQGEFISILGKSGSGKSTLMHTIGLLDRPTRGNLYLEGKRINEPTDDELAKVRSKKIGFIFQSFNLLARTSALDNVLLPTIYAKTPKTEARTIAETLLKKVGLETKMKNLPNQLSGGQQQRVAIARALVNNPAIILADEPTGNLDSKSSGEILDYLHQLHEDGKTIVIVTHDEDISKLTHRVIRVNDGQIVEDVRK